MIRIENLSRRDALKGAAASGLMLGVYGADANAAPGAKAQFEPSAYIGLETNGKLTLTVGRSESGQGIRTTLAMILADEMAADWDLVTIRQADGDPKYGDQDTEGSRSIRLFYTVLRQAGATARQMLENAAAQTWRASIRDCRAVDHKVIHVPTGRALGFGDLAKLASMSAVPAADRIRLKDASSRRYIGHPLPMVDLPAILRGKAVFAGDIVLPGMRYASIERCPVYGGAVKSFDSKDAQAVRGVDTVVEIPASPIPTGHLPLGGIAVVARNSWSALEGRKKLKIEWDMGPNATHDSVAYRAELEANVKKPGKQVRNQGQIDAALRGNGKSYTADYFVPYYAHATMEPPVAVAAFENGKLTVWAPTQNPQDARTVVAKYMGLKDTDVSIQVTLLGGALGRNAMHDFICEAAWLAKNTGAPVKVQWSREDDIRHGYYHPMSAQRLEGSLDSTGVPAAWRHRTSFPPPASTFNKAVTEGDANDLGQGVTDMPYLVPNVRCEVAGSASHMRIGSSRAAMNIAHAFAVCSFIDELAAAAGKDPANYIYTVLAGPRKLDLKMLNVVYPNYDAPIDDYPVDVGRLQSVLQLVMDRSGWGDQLQGGQGRGVAVHRSFCSYSAAVAQVTMTPEGQLSIDRLDVAIDCGMVINPDRIRSQMEGAAMFGVGLALYGGVTVKDGAVQQGNFDTYRLPRMDAMPETKIHLVPSTMVPSGVGDPGVPVIAPAITNAIFAATGKRIRSLPIDMALLKA